MRWLLEIIHRGRRELSNTTLSITWLLIHWGLSYNTDLMLSQTFQLIAAQLSKKAALPFANFFVTASCRSSKRGPWPWFNIKMSSYQYRKSHCGDKTILRPSSLHKGISYTGKTASLYWNQGPGPLNRHIISSHGIDWVHLDYLGFSTREIK